jgi:4-deoxy-L-threo-5-hexosulose-uronate ketol-isomerase
VPNPFHIVKSRLLPGPRETAGLNTAALRESFLVQDLFAGSEIRIELTDMDRLAIGGAVPHGRLDLPACAEFGTGYFTERREIGIVNIGEAGHVLVGEHRYSLGTRDFLYIGAGNPDIAFESCEGKQPCFYFLSCPADRSLPTVRIGFDEITPEEIGETHTASRRKLYRFIHAGGAASCRLVMGLTELQSGSVWNTMPPHTHSRRCEVYLYTGLEDGIAMHLLGEPGQTRHVVVHDREAVLSPSWSIHTAAGSRPYSFIWGMTGENQSFTDMDPVSLLDLR